MIAIAIAYITILTVPVELMFVRRSWATLLRRDTTVPHMPHRSSWAHTAISSGMKVIAAAINGHAITMSRPRSSNCGCRCTRNSAPRRASFKLLAGTGMISCTYSHSTQIFQYTYRHTYFQVPLILASRIDGCYHGAYFSTNTHSPRSG